MTRLNNRSARSSGDMEAISGNAPDPKGVVVAAASGAALLAPSLKNTRTTSARIAAAGRPHLSAGEIAGTRTLPSIDAPHLWQNRASGRNSVPHSEQNRGFEFISSLACFSWFCPPSHENDNQNEPANHDHYRKHVEHHVEAGHLRLEKNPLSVSRHEIRLHLVGTLTRAKPVAHDRPHLLSQLRRRILNGLALTYRAPKR